MTARRSLPTSLPPVDHLVWGGRRLEEEIDRFEAWTGVRAVPGGRHPGEGTHNALLGLGPGMYLELIAPDLAAPAPTRPRWFGLDRLVAARLVAWAAKAAGLDGVAATARADALELGEVRDGRRDRPDGSRLAWRLTDPGREPDAAVVPFLIEWAEGPHPADTAPSGMRLVELRGEHPDPAAIAEPLRHLEIDLAVSAGARPALVATVETPRGRLELR